MTQKSGLLPFLAGCLLLAACTSGVPAAQQTAAAEEPLPEDFFASITPNPPPAEESLDFLERMAASDEFSTNFTIYGDAIDGIVSGGPRKDGIPAIDQPRYVSMAQADGWLRPQEPVIQVEVGGVARAYPIQILIWHEIVNDELNGLPLAVTFCPLCNTAIVFQREVDGQVLDFGTTGRLRYSNLIMYDRQSESWWQQANGEAIIGDFTGTRLANYPALIVAWEDFKTAYPNGDVLSPDTGYTNPYGQNPYPGYDDINVSPFLYRGPQTPGQLPAMARVLTIELGNEAVAFPYSTLEEIGLVNSSVDSQAVLVLWQPGVVSPLQTSFTGAGRDVGAAAAYSRELDGLILNFYMENGNIYDEQTGSRWDLFGRAVAGDLAGAELHPIVAINHFWFSWAAFRPDTIIYQP